MDTRRIKKHQACTRWLIALLYGAAYALLGRHLAFLCCIEDVSGLREAIDEIGGMIPYLSIVFNPHGLLLTWREVWFLISLDIIGFLFLPPLLLRVFPRKTRLQRLLVMGMVGGFIVGIGNLALSIPLEFLLGGDVLRSSVRSVSPWVLNYLFAAVAFALLSEWLPLRCTEEEDGAKSVM